MFGRERLHGHRLHLRRPRFQPPTMHRLVPNALTVLALCAGLTGLRFGLEGRWDLAIFAVIIAGILDLLDGRMAKLLNAQSKFGAELDSLADFVSFGAVPAMLVYMWTLQNLGGIGWAIGLVFAVCCALRLARFNTMIGDPNPPPWAGAYFVGVPAPAGAGLALLPMAGAIQFGPGFFDRPSLNAVVLLGVAALMVSRVPTFSIKKVKITPAMTLPLLLLVVLLAAALATEPFVTYLVAGVLYLGSIPVSIWTQSRARRAAAVEQPMPAPALPGISAPEQAPTSPPPDEAR
jgi:CDP-diacylglycerol--serine O-phosphatidyltransferase